MKKLAINLVGLLIGILILTFFMSIFASYWGIPAPWQIKRVKVNDNPAYFIEDYWDNNNPELCVIFLDKNLLLWQANVKQKKQEYIQEDISNLIRLDRPKEQTWGKKIKMRMIKEGKL